MDETFTFWPSSVSSDSMSIWMTVVEGVDYTVGYGRGTITALEGGGIADGVDYLVDYETRAASSVSLNVSSTAGTIDREVHEGMTMSVNVSGEEVFNATFDVFEVLVRLKDSLWRNDGDGVRSVMDDVDGALDQVISITGAVGAKVHRLELADQRIQSEIIHTQKLLSRIEEIDLAETLMRLKAEELTYQTALSVGGRIMLSTLLDFIQ